MGGLWLTICNLVLSFPLEFLCPKKYPRFPFFRCTWNFQNQAKKIGSGTGFIYFHRASNSHFLVTNYHVFTCRDPKEPARLLPGYPDSPDEIAFSLLSSPEFLPRLGSIRIDAESKWLEHPRRSEGVDIVAAKIQPPSDAIVVSQEDLCLIEDIEIEAGSELIIIGFPFGFSVDNYFPIWKRGMISSEPSYKPHGISKFYIDAHTHPGMSGSPVFAATQKDIVNLSGQARKDFELYESGEISALEAIRSITPSLHKHETKQCFKLIGIYSGRVDNGANDPNIGIVWQKSLIDEIFSNPVAVTHPYPPIVVDSV